MNLKHAQNTLLLALCCLAFACSKNKATSSATDSTRVKFSSVMTEGSSFTSHLYGFSIAAPTGYSVASDDEETIDIRHGDAWILAASVTEPNAWHLERGKTLDSLDVLKGVAMSYARSGPPLGEPDGCGSQTTVDSIVQFQNSSGLRTIRVNSTYRMFCEDSTSSSSQWVQYFVDINQGSGIRFIYLWHMNASPEMDQLCLGLVQRIRLVPQSH